MQQKRQESSSAPAVKQPDKETELAAQKSDKAQDGDEKKTSADVAEPTEARKNGVDEEEIIIRKSDKVQNADEQPIDAKKTKEDRLQTLAQIIYQIGSETGLPPREVLFQINNMQFPAFILPEKAQIFKANLLGIYQAVLDREIEEMKQTLGLAD